MKTPKWQRARVVRAELNPPLLGLQLWVEAVPPVVMSCYEQSSGRHRCGPRVRTNIREIAKPHRQLVVNPKGLELLARGPEDFADDVPLITWEQWLKESAPEKPA